MLGMARSETDFLLRKTTRQILDRLEEETGVNPGYMKNGSLIVSSTKVRNTFVKDDEDIVSLIFSLVAIKKKFLVVMIMLSFVDTYYINNFLIIKRNVVNYQIYIYFM